MVFKVKQRAERRYERIIKDTRDDPRFEFEFDLGTGLSRNVTYNWPYDYFSLVELGRLDASVRIGGEPLLTVGVDRDSREFARTNEEPSGIDKQANVIMKAQDIVKKVEVLAKTEEPNVEKKYSKYIKDPKKLPEKAIKKEADVEKKKIKPQAKKILPKGLMTKKEKRDFFNKKEPEKSPFYKKKAAAKGEVKSVGAGFATKKEKIEAAKVDKKAMVKKARAPKGKNLKF